MEDLEQAGLKAVDRFIDTWNSRDAEAWGRSLHYPHVRPAPVGPITVADDLNAYVDNVDFDKVVATGWDHSEWDYKHVLHVSPSRIHVAGQWSRYTANQEKILTTPIIYVCTRIDQQWGIQSRFSADYVDEDTDTTELMSRGLNLIQDYANHHRAGNRDAAAELLNYPHINVGVGRLDVTETSRDFDLASMDFRIESMIAVQTGKLSMNAAVELSVEGERRLQAVVNLTNRNNHLGIQAWSFLDPEEIAD